MVVEVGSDVVVDGVVDVVVVVSVVVLVVVVVVVVEVGELDDVGRGVVRVGRGSSVGFPGWPGATLPSPGRSAIVRGVARAPGLPDRGAVVLVPAAVSPSDAVVLSVKAPPRATASTCRPATWATGSTSPTGP